MRSGCSLRSNRGRFLVAATGLLAVLLVWPSIACADADPGSIPPNFVPAQVAELVNQLSAPTFKTRVNAQKQLSLIGSRFPKELGTLALEADPESQLRLVRVLEEVFLSRTDAAADSAEKALESIRNSHTSGATDAGSVLIGNARLRESRARKKIEQLGGQLAYSIPVESRPVPTAPRIGVGFGEHCILQTILISEDWTGTADDLWQFRRLSHHKNLLLYNIRSNHLHLEDLMALGDDLNGLFVSERGACLGVRGANSAGTMLISEIVPNSAAEAADLRPQDEVKFLNEHEVRNFSHLVELLLLYAPGETIMIKVRREGRMLDIPVTLSSWRHMPLSDPPFDGQPADFAGPLGQARPVPPPLPEKVRPDPLLRFSME